MKNRKIFSTLIIAFSISVYGQTPMAIQYRPKITVSGTGSISTFPNAANITLILKFVKPTLRESLNETQKIEKEVRVIIKKYITDTLEIKTSLVSTDKSFEWNNALRKEVLIGFESSQKIIFTLKDLKQMQKFTEEILKTRIYEIEKVAYFHTEAADFYKKAQDLAVLDAKETTDRLAKAAQLTLGKIISIQTNGSPNTAMNNTINSQSFQTYNKGMGGQGISSSGQLIYYTANVSMNTEIE